MNAVGYRPAYVNRFGTTTAVWHPFDADNDWFRDYDRIHAEAETWASIAFLRRHFSRWELLEWDELLAIPPKPPISEHAEAYDLLPEVGFPLDQARVNAAWRQLPQWVRDGDEGPPDVLAALKVDEAVVRSIKRQVRKRRRKKHLKKTITIRWTDNVYAIERLAEHVKFSDDHWLWTHYGWKVWVIDSRGNNRQVNVPRAMWLLEFGDELTSSDRIDKKCSQPGCCNPTHYIRRYL